MHRKVSYTGIAAMIIGILLTAESILEGNSMLMWESIILAFFGLCYIFPVKNIVTSIIRDYRNRKVSEGKKTQRIFDTF